MDQKEENDNLILMAGETVFAPYKYLARLKAIDKIQSGHFANGTEKAKRV